MPAGQLSRAPMAHPAVVCGGSQLLKVIEELEAGTYPQPEDAIWRGDVPHDVAVRLALATGASREQIAEIQAQREALEDCTVCGRAIFEGDRVEAYAGCTAHYDCVPRVPAPTAAEADARGHVTIRHTHEDGTLVYGTSKGDGTAEILRACRFRWFPSIKLWGVAQSRDHLAKRWQIDSAAKQLEAAGFAVTVEIDDTPRDVAEAKADRAERLDTRYDRLTAKAARNLREAESRHAAADQISERFAGGQPILVGHHSERRARRDQERMQNHDRAANDAYRKAGHAQQAASVVGSADAYRERPGVIRRRIDRLEAELRQTMHYINGRRPANDWRGAYSPDRKPATGAYLEQLAARKAFLEHQIAGDRAALAEHEANGYVLLTRETVHKGDVVSWSACFGDSATVTRVNPKTVSLDRTRWPSKLGYEQIKSVECPHQGTTTTVRAPERPEARPAPEPVKVERPAKRPAPVEVGASSELFPTPRAIAERMADEARLQPGMTALEPSAGLGALASVAIERGAVVDCVELECQLADRLKFTVGARTVWIADFLDKPQRAEYDAVLMNPPFRNQADIRHVTHALGFLKPGGLLVAVMSAGAEFRQDKTAAAFRDLVAGCGGRIERLPDGAFEASGTGVSTVLAVIPAPVATGAAPESPTPAATEAEAAGMLFPMDYASTR